MTGAGASAMGAEEAGALGFRGPRIASSGRRIGIGGSHGRL